MKHDRRRRLETASPTAVPSNLRNFETTEIKEATLAKNNGCFNLVWLGGSNGGAYSPTFEDSKIRRKPHAGAAIACGIRHLGGLVFTLGDSASDENVECGE
jgi:hypothetical protein